MQNITERILPRIGYTSVLSNVLLYMFPMRHLQIARCISVNRECEARPSYSPTEISNTYYTY